MSSSKAVLEMVNLYDAARETLRRYGHPYVKSRTTVYALAVNMLGGEHEDEKATLTEFVQKYRNAMPIVKLTSVRHYVFDRSMQMAAQRAACQPTMIGVNSKKELPR
jgi:hypothetical protein